MSRTVGCIGCGHMGGAILAGLVERMKHQGYIFAGYNRSPQRMEPLAARGVKVYEDAMTLAQDSEILVLAVKPYQVAAVLQEIRPALNADKIVISVAAGVSLKSLQEGVNPRSLREVVKSKSLRPASGQCAVVRCMPNTPALVGEGVFAFSFEDPNLTEERRSEVLKLFGSLGLCLEIPEAQFTAFSALIGAGPAYVFEMMQGLVQAGVTLGFQHAEARRMVAALLLGSARMAQEAPDKPLMQLRDEVCSPGGLTIAGVNHLDRKGLLGLLVDAVLAADARGREMEN